MSSYFYLTLDTTPPNVNVNAPNNVMPGIVSEIYVNASEPIAEYQDIYIVDSAGDRYDLSFQYQPESNRYYGELNFHGYAIGLATIYARLRDNVDNLSSLVSKVIDIKSATLLNYIALSGRFNEEILLQDSFKTMENLLAGFIEEIDIAGSFEEQRELTSQFAEAILLQGNFQITENQFGKFVEQIDLAGSFEEQKELCSQFFEQIDLAGSFVEEKELYSQFGEDIDIWGRW